MTLFCAHVGARRMGWPASARVALPPGLPRAEMLTAWQVGCMSRSRAATTIDGLYHDLCSMWRKLHGSKRVAGLRCRKWFWSLSEQLIEGCSMKCNSSSP